MNEIGIYFPPNTSFDAFVEMAYPVVRSIIDHGFFPERAFSGGTSEKDALSRPKLLGTPEQFRATIGAKKESFESDLIFRAGFWTPENYQRSIMLERTRPPAKTSLSVVLEDDNGPEIASEFKEWAINKIITPRLALMAYSRGTPGDDLYIQWININGSFLDLGNMDTKQRIKFLNALQGCENLNEMLALYSTTFSHLS